MNFRGNNSRTITALLVQLYKHLVNILAEFVAVPPANDWTAEPDGCPVTPAAEVRTPSSQRQRPAEPKQKQFEIAALVPSP
jgi:hypothetical protein